MSQVDILKEQIQAAVSAEQSEAVLAEVSAVLNRKLPLVSEEMEAGIAEGIADIEAGRFYTLKEFDDIADKENKQLKKRYMR